MQFLRICAKVIVLTACLHSACLTSVAQSDDAPEAAPAKPAAPAELRLQPKWLQDQTGAVTGLWFRDQTAQGPGYFSVDIAGKERKQLVDPVRLAAALSAATGRTFDGASLPIERLDFDGKAVYLLLQGEAKVYSCDVTTYTCAAETGPALDRFGLPPLAAVRSSNRTGASSAVIVLNNSPGDVQMNWVDTAGKRVAYGKIKPGNQFRQHTFGGHVWLITDAAGKELRCVEAADEPGLVVISADAQTTPPPAAKAKPESKSKPAQGPREQSPDGTWTITTDNPD